MLKRQRPASPIPTVDIPFEEPFPEVYEPDTKRRKFFSSNGGHAENYAGIDDCEVSDGEESRHSAADEGRKEYFTGRHEWREAAGEYKSANTLLHDLHAEQQHRMIFAAPSTNTSPHTPHVHPENLQNYAQWLSSNKYSPPLDEFTTLPQRDKHSLHLFMPPSNDVDRKEVRTVTERYEDTNKFLGSLVLSRRHNLNVVQNAVS